MNQRLASESCNNAKAFPGSEGFFSALQEVLRENGANLTANANKWALGIKEALAPDGADSDFDILCSRGCHPVSLAASIFAAEFYPIAVLSFRAAFGISKQRAGYSNKLRQAAEILGKTVFSETLGEGLWLKLKSRHGSLPEPPSAMICDLEFYAKLFEFAELISRNAGIKSNHDLPRFIVTGYVHLATGRWHDSEVSALLQGGGTEIYDETAHRVWRNRNFSRLKRHYVTFPEILLKTGELLGKSK